MRLILFILLSFFTSTLSAQNKEISHSIKSAFTGRWGYKTSFQTNTVVIWFDQGKDYANFKNIGSGMAPPQTFRAKVKGNLLIIPAKQGQNDEIEITVIKGKLYLSIKQIVWDKKENILKRESIERKIFKRIAEHK